jgi:hypothetical protein
MSSLRTDGLAASWWAPARPWIVAAGIVAGNGSAVVRPWVDASGLGRYELGLVVVSAALVALAGAAMAVTAAAEVWFEPSPGWRSIVPIRPGYVVLGVAVVLLLPLAWGDGTALAYALPWGVGLAAAGWLCGRAAVAAGWSVTVSAVTCAVIAFTVHALEPSPGGD